MPYVQLSWAETVLCTVRDVRTRLLSPEVPFGLTADDDTRFVVTADATTDVFTCTVPHGFTNGQQVGFENTGGALPAPLIANTGYFILTATSLTFQVSTIAGGAALNLTTSGTGTTSAYSNALDIEIQTKIDLSKEFVEQELINYFQTTIPGDIRGFLAYKRSQLNEGQSIFSRNLELADRGTGSWNYPMYGYLLPDGLLLDNLGNGLYANVPPLRFNYGAPTNGAAGTFPGVPNGTILADMRNRVLYINRETDNPPTSPVWEKFLVSDALDYILNPSVLKLMAVSYALILMTQDGTLRNRAYYTSEEAQKWGSWVEKKMQAQYEKDKNRAIALLDIDISGSGEMNDWKRGFVRQEIAVAG